MALLEEVPLFHDSWSYNGHVRMTYVIYTLQTRQILEKKIIRFRKKTRWRNDGRKYLYRSA